MPGLHRGKKGSGPILSNFLGCFFQFFKKKIENIGTVSPRRGLALSMQIVNFLIEFLWALYCFLDFTERDLHWYNASPRRGLALSMQIVNFLIEFLWALYCFLDFTERDLHW